MPSSQVQFSIASHAAWAPGLPDLAAWREWAFAPQPIRGSDTAPVTDMPAMLRRRAGFLGKMALEAAYQCAGDAQQLPTVFCSRHGDVARALELLRNVVAGEPMSPTSFGLAVHNANAGLFSIARQDQSNQCALAAGSSSVEHAVIEACGLLADGADRVLLVVYDTSLPDVYAPYLDCAEQPQAWAWIMTAVQDQYWQLSWTGSDVDSVENSQAMPGSLTVWQFYLNQSPFLERSAQRRRWRWSRHG